MLPSLLSRSTLRAPMRRWLLAGCSLTARSKGCSSCPAKFALGHKDNEAAPGELKQNRHSVVDLDNETLEFTPDPHLLKSALLSYSSSLIAYVGDMTSTQRTHSFLCH